VLVGLEVNLKDQGVAVLDLLHGGLRGDGGNDDLVGVHSVVVGHGLSGIFGGSGQLQGVGQSEGGVGSDLGGLLSIATLQSGFLSGSSLGS
jgi:hypothetical protein